MPSDNAATVAAGADIAFPSPAVAAAGTGITSISTTEFQLAIAGVYRVMWQVSVTEAGQLELLLNGTVLPYTVVGRATGTSQIVGMALVVTTAPNSYIEVQNPAGNTPALTITPIAGGTATVSANLIIERIQ